MDENRCEGSEHREPADPSVDRLSDDDQGILLCAARYCIGRMSYIVGSCDLWLRERWPRLSTGIQKTILRDIHEALERHRLGHGSIGMEMDERVWAALYRDLSPPTGPVDLGERSNTESSPETAPATPASPPAVVDYTEWARGDVRNADDPLVDVALEITEQIGAAAHAGKLGVSWGIAYNALSAVASEHQAALQLAEAKVVQLSETAGEDYSVGFEAGAKALLARLPEPEMRDAAIHAACSFDGSLCAWPVCEESADCGEPPGLLPNQIDAALAVITEKLEGRP